MRQTNFLLRHLRISNAALNVFPRFRNRYRVLSAMRNLSGAPMRRFGWFIPALARFSGFLEWLESDDEGDSP